MKRSELNWQTEKNVSSKEHSVDFLLRMGLIWKLEPGVYYYSPLLNLYLENLKKILTKHMNSLGYFEITTFPFSSRSFWNSRNDILNEAFVVSDKVFHPTSEETVFYILEKNKMNRVFSFSTNFRNEPRVSFALVRSFAFVMKDAYAIFENNEQMNLEYERVKEMYTNFFEYFNISFHIKENQNDCEFLGISKSELKTDLYLNENVIELGHIFKFENTFKKPCISFGVGISRLIQYFVSENKLSYLLPFDYGICLKTIRAYDLYKALSFKNNVFLDDSSLTISEKIYDLKSIGFSDEDIFVL